MTLSRRRFLQIAGITLTNIYTAKALLPHAKAAPTVAHGRAFAQTPVLDSGGNAVRTLWADEVVEIVDRTGEHFTLADGIVPTSALQAVAPYDPPATITAFPKWAEVVAPSAAIRAYAAPDAPLVDRIGYGGVRVVTGQLDAWYQMARFGEGTIGWTQAAHWAPVVQRIAPTAGILLTLDTETQVLKATHKNELLHSTLVATNPIAPGTYRLERGQPGIDDPKLGTPYHLRARDHDLSIMGTYWHNDRTPTSPNAIEVNTLVARWLYFHGSYSLTVV